VVVVNVRGDEEDGQVMARRTLLGEREAERALSITVYDTP